jgi:hypothetical protein
MGAQAGRQHPVEDRGRDGAFACAGAVHAFGSDWAQLEAGTFQARQAFDSHLKKRGNDEVFQVKIARWADYQRELA